MNIASPRGPVVDRAALPAGPFVWFHRAAAGPNYGVGPPEQSPGWTPSGLTRGRVVMVPANFGLAGGTDVDPVHRDERWPLRIVLSRIEYPAPTNPYGPEGTPMWNALPPQQGFGWWVRSPESEAVGGQVGVQDVQSPAVYVEPTQATLAAAATAASTGWWGK